MVIPSPTVPVSGENEVMLGATGAVVSIVTPGRGRHAGIAGGIGCGRGQAVRTVGQRRRGISPGPAAVGRRAAHRVVPS